MFEVIAYIFLGIAISLALIYIAGLLLPENRFASRKIIINASCDDVWNVVTNVKSYNNWRSDIERTKILIDNQDILVWMEYPKAGKPIKFIEKKRIEKKEWWFDWEEMNGSVSGYWIGKFTETMEGAELESNQYAILKNPFIRTLSYLFFDLEDVMKKFQLSVKSHLEENA